MPHLTAEALDIDPEGLALLRDVLRRPRTSLARNSGVTDLGEVRLNARKPEAVARTPAVGERHAPVIPKAACRS